MAGAVPTSSLAAAGAVPSAGLSTAAADGFCFLLYALGLALVSTGAGSTGVTSAVIGALVAAGAVLSSAAGGVPSAGLSAAAADGFCFLLYALGLALVSAGGASTVVASAVLVAAPTFSLAAGVATDWLTSEPLGVCCFRFL